MKNACECCMMPLSKDPLGDNRENLKYCSYCYSNGELHADKIGSLKEFQDIVYKNMHDGGHSWLMCKFATWSIGFAPYWKARQK